MLFQTVAFSLGLVVCTSARVLSERQVATFPIPDACTTTCVNFVQIATLLGQSQIPPCTTDTQQAIITCYTCVETNAPTELTTDVLSYAQTATNALVTHCNTAGSPLPAASIPGATGTTYIPTDGSVPTILVSLTASATASTTPAPGAGSGSGNGSAAPSSSSSRSGAMAIVPQTFSAVAVVAFAAMVFIS